LAAGNWLDGPSLDFLPFDRDSRSLQNTLRGLGHFGADAIAWYEGNFVRRQSILIVCEGISDVEGAPLTVSTSAKTRRSWGRELTLLIQ
jgi:hypothetical protein